MTNLGWARPVISRWFGVASLVLLADTAPASAIEDVRSVNSGFQRAEAFVLEEIKAGRVANLKQQFPDPKDRTLRASFIENLLTHAVGDAHIHRRGIRIQYAVFDEPVDLSNATVSHETWLDYCEFKASIDLSSSTFRKALSFEGSTFSDVTSGTNFDSMALESDLFLTGAVFNGPVDFSNVRIALNLRAERTQFNATNTTANFNTMRVGGSVFLRKAAFAGPADLQLVQISRNLEADEVRFTHTGGKADFGGMRVGGMVFLVKARFEGPARFSGISVGEGLRLNEATFSRGADFGFAQISQNIELSDARFTSEKDEVNFNTMKAGVSVFLRKAAFAGPVDFQIAQITQNLEGTGAQFTHKTAVAEFAGIRVGGHMYFDKSNFGGPTSFISMSVGGSTSLEEAQLAGRVDFALAQIGQNLSADRARFMSKRDAVRFDTMKVGVNVLLRKTEFGGPVSFRFVQIAQSLDADDATFTSERAAVDFTTMKVGINVLLRKTRFAGPVDFRVTQITQNLDGAEAQFTSKLAAADFGGTRIGGHMIFDKATFSGPAWFEGMSVGGSAFLQEAQFAGPANFAAAQIGENLEGQRSYFGSKTEQAVFNSILVKGRVVLRETTFSGPVDFKVSRIGQNFEMVKSKMMSASATADFEGIRVGGILLLQDMSSEGDVVLADAEVQDLLAVRLHGMRLLDLSRTVVRRECRLEDVSVKNINATSLQVLGPAAFQRMNMSSGANFENSHFQILTIGELTWPDDPSAVSFQNMSYNRIVAGDQKESWRRLLAWIEQSRFSTQPYLQLEAFLKADGHPESADEVFVAMKERERRDTLGGPSTGRWWSNLMLQSLVRYGRSPQYAFIWSGFIVVFGMFVFLRRQDVEPRKREDKHSPYNPLWYSLNLFLPVVDLNSDAVWMPRQDSPFRRHYARVHRILGWILIPIGLAAITGIIK